MMKNVEVENEAIHQDNRKEFFKRFFDLQNESFVPTGILFGHYSHVVKFWFCRGLWKQKFQSNFREYSNSDKACFTPQWDETDEWLNDN